MKKIILFLVLIQLLGCNSSNENKTNVTNQKKSGIFSSQQVKKLEAKVQELYKDEKEVRYKFNGDLTKEVVPYISGKNLIIPISPSKVQDSDYLSIGVILDFEKKVELVILDSLMIDYSDFKNLIEKADEWIVKTNSFDAKNTLEIPLIDKINIIFPQNEKPREFKAVMLFAQGTREREILLREIGEKNNEDLINISLKKEHIEHIKEGLSPLYIAGAIDQSYFTIEEEIESVKNQYEELNLLLK
ncbi:MAG: hypothetical protein ACRCUD_08785 [Cetobacterium sp.]